LNIKNKSKFFNNKNTLNSHLKDQVWLLITCLDPFKLVAKFIGPLKTWGASQVEFNHQIILFKVWSNDYFLFCKLYNAKISHKELTFQHFITQMNTYICNFKFYIVKFLMQKILIYKIDFATFHNSNQRIHYHLWFEWM
jgi:hypothetical protein